MFNLSFPEKHSTYRYFQRHVLLWPQPQKWEVMGNWETVRLAELVSYSTPFCMSFALLANGFLFLLPSFAKLISSVNSWVRTHFFSQIIPNRWVPKVQMCIFERAGKGPNTKQRGGTFMLGRRLGNSKKKGLEKLTTFSFQGVGCVSKRRICVKVCSRSLQTCNVWNYIKRFHDAFRSSNSNIWILMSEGALPKTSYIHLRIYIYIYIYTYINIHFILFDLHFYTLNQNRSLLK